MAVRAQILVAYDDHGFRAFARAMLERDGFTVAEAATSTAAAEAARAARPRLGLLDIQPPDSDGFQVAGWLAGQGPGLRRRIRGCPAPAGSRLRGLADRVGSAGGLLRIDSPPGSGTRLEAYLPCP